MRLRIKVVATAMIVAMLGALAMSAAPASASVAQGYIAGTGAWADDWGDEGPVSASTRSYNNVVAMWQMILWADGYLTRSEIDCRFGPVTTAATKRWQSDRGLPSDGVVGPNTLSKAATRLSVYEQELWFYYDGAGTNYFFLGRRDDGRWDMAPDFNGEWELLSYTYASFSICS